MRYPNGRRYIQTLSNGKKLFLINHNRRNKFHARKVTYNGQKFDSKTELRYYFYLKQRQIRFKIHPRFPIINHIEFIRNHHVIKIRKHSYTPDFVIYKNGRMQEVDDIKGVSLVPAYDHLRMDLFTMKYHIPVTIVRCKHRHFIKKVRNL